MALHSAAGDRYDEMDRGCLACATAYDGYEDCDHCPEDSGDESDVEHELDLYEDEPKDYDPLGPRSDAAHDFDPQADPHR